MKVLSACGVAACNDCDPEDTTEEGAKESIYSKMVLGRCRQDKIKVRMGHAALGDAHAEVHKIGRRLYDEAQAREAREQKASVEMANRQSMGMGGGFGGMMTDAMAPAT